MQASLEENKETSWTFDMPDESKKLYNLLKTQDGEKYHFTIYHAEDIDDIEYHTGYDEEECLWWNHKAKVRRRPLKRIDLRDYQGQKFSIYPDKKDYPASGYFSEITIHDFICSQKLVIQ